MRATTMIVRASQDSSWAVEMMQAGLGDGPGVRRQVSGAAADPAANGNAPSAPANQVLVPPPRWADNDAQPGLAACMVSLPVPPCMCCRVYIVCLAWPADHEFLA